MKKWILIVFAAAMIGGVLAGCQSSEGDPATNQPKPEGTTKAGDADAKPVDTGGSTGH